MVWTHLQTVKLITQTTADSNTSRGQSHRAWQEMEIKEKTAAALSLNRECIKDPNAFVCHCCRSVLPKGPVCSLWLPVLGLDPDYQWVHQTDGWTWSFTRSREGSKSFLTFLRQLVTFSDKSVNMKSFSIACTRRIGQRKSKITE